MRACVYEPPAAYGKFINYAWVFYCVQARDTLSAENVDVCEQLREAKIKIHALA